MEKSKGRGPSSPQPAGPPPTAAQPALVAATSGLPWTVTWCVLGALFISLLWYPVSKLSAHYSFGSNEGFNTAFQAMAAAGAKVYGNPPVYSYANYPPISFHLIAWLSAVTHDVNLTGRWLSFLAYLAIGGLIALIVSRLIRSRALGAYAAACWLIWLPAFDAGRVGLNDPHLLGVAFNLAGLYFFVRDPETNRGAAISAAVFAISLFTKQSLVAIPAAVAIYLFLSSRKRLAVWLAAAVGTSLALLALTLVVDGKYFFDHLFLPRMYFASDAWGSLGAYLYFTQVAFLLALIWMLRATQHSVTGLFIWALPLTHVLATYYCGGAGAGVNHFFDGMIVIAILTGLALPSLLRLAEGTRYPRATLSFLLIGPCFLTSFVALARRLPADFAHPADETAKMETEFSGVSSYIKGQPGAALCESQLLCYAAGKPYTYDPFSADQLVRTGRIPLEQLVQLIDRKEYRVIQLDWPSNEALQPSPRVRFPGPVMRALFVSYQPAIRSAKYVVFTAK